MNKTSLSAYLYAVTILHNVGAAAQTWSPPAPEARCPSKWGAADERGAANLITRESVLSASKLIRTGEDVELGRVLRWICLCSARVGSIFIPSVPADR